MKFCRSCGIILDGRIAKEHSNSYCEYCINENGELKSREEIRAGIVEWLKMFSPEQEGINFVKRADSYMNAMPEWAEK